MSYGGQLGSFATDNPLLVMLEYDVADPRNMTVIKTSLNSISDAVVNPAQPRTGTIAYAFSKPLKGDDKVFMTELFHDPEAQRNHITENEGEAIVEMYTEKMIEFSRGGVVGVPKEASTVRESMMSSLGAICVDHREGSAVLNMSVIQNKFTKKDSRAKPKMGKQVLLELRITPSDKETAVKAASDLVSTSNTVLFLTGVVIEQAWWETESKEEIGLYILLNQIEYPQAVFSRSKLEKLVSCSKSIKLIVTAETWQNPHLEDFCEYLNDSGIFVSERRELFAGFLTHPAYCQEWDAILEKYREEQASKKPENATPFTVRYHPLSGNPEALVIEERPGKASKDGTINVPLLHLLRKIAYVSRNDNEVPIGMVYAQLGRLRDLAAFSRTLSGLSDDQDVSENPELADYFSRVLNIINSLGYSMPETGRASVEFSGIENCIDLMEKEYAPLISQGKRAREDVTVPIAYMALQEIYRVGDIVSSRSIGALGGTLVGLRVVDVYYEPIRSLLGGRKFSFRLILETILSLSGEYVSVQFTHIFEEWRGDKEQRHLPFLRVREGSLEMKELTERVPFVRRIDTKKHSYHYYSAGSFFPHLSGRKSLGGASSGDSKAGAGRLIVDSVRGTALGHSPANAIDNLGSAIAQTAKSLKTVQRSLKDLESASQRAAKFASAGLRVLDSLSPTAELVCWPTVVAFSLTVKQWGHVLIEGLSPVLPSLDAWNQLLLPNATKEMLLAMTSPPKTPRYKYRDIVDSKGGGVLFLLYGPPGTGKTLTVEALASRFAHPLYSLSFAELGSSVAELEERLTDVLALAAEWNALVLLDEGDALVELRQKGQFMLNSMTGVLLRLLETFDGVLFITSNRASSFDPAALSRVTLAIRYEPLTLNLRRQIWKNSLCRVLRDEIDGDGKKITRSSSEIEALVEKRFNLDGLKTFAGSGRGVGAVIRLAVGLSHQRDCEIDQKILEDARVVFEAFSKDLTAEGVAEGWDN